MNRWISCLMVVGLALSVAGPGRAQDGVGYLVLSIAQRDGTRFSSYELHYRSKATGKTDRVSYRDVGLFNLVTDDVDEKDKTGVVKVERLAAGLYELVTFEVTSGGYPGERRYGPPKPFSIPFTIKPGEATYLGEFMGVSGKRSSFIGIGIHSDPYFVVSDQQDRDMRIARRRHDDIGEVTVTVPDTASLGLAAFRDKPAD